MRTVEEKKFDMARSIHIHQKRTEVEELVSMSSKRKCSPLVSLHKVQLEVISHQGVKGSLHCGLLRSEFVWPHGHA